MFYLIEGGIFNIVWKHDQAIDLWVSFPHTSNLQQTTLKSSWLKYGEYLKMKVKLLDMIHIIENWKHDGKSKKISLFATMYSKSCLLPAK